MKESIDVAVRLVRAGKQAYARKWSFLGLFAFVFFGSVIALGRLDLLPEEAPTKVAAAAAAATGPVIPAGARGSKPVALIESPARIEIPAIGLAASIANPTTLDIAALDEELLSGAVRYPTSAELGETGNVVLFGHSSYLPIVRNRAYKTFNGIQKLVAGDAITVYSSDTAYTYRVRNVAKENVGSDGIPLATAGRVLTLATCDSFGAKTDRFVVAADFVESHSVSN